MSDENTSADTNSNEPEQASPAVAPQKFDPIHQQIDPANANDPGADLIHLPSLVSDEFGMDRSQVRMMISTGTVKLLATGVLPEQVLDRNKMDFPYGTLFGRVISIESGEYGPAQSVQFLYKG